MFKKMIDFQRVLYFPNNFDATESNKTYRENNITICFS